MKKVFVIILILLSFLITSYLVVNFKMIETKFSIKNINTISIELKENIKTRPFYAFSYFFNSKEKIEILKISSMAYFFIIFLIIGLYIQTKKGDYYGIEKGSANFGTAIDRKSYGIDVIKEKKLDNEALAENVSYNNIILSNTEFLPSNDRKIYRNLNQLIIGGSGAGKTRTYVKPNIAQANMNYIITDPKGELYQTTAPALEKEGYKTYVLNLVNPMLSFKFNPFKYIKSSQGLIILVESIIKNTTGNGEKEDFWVKTERALLTATMLYMYEIKGNNATLYDVYNLIINATNYKEAAGEALIDKFNQIIKADHMAMNYFKNFSTAIEKMRAQFLTSLGLRLAFLGDPNLINLTSCDEFEFEKVDEKRAIFVILNESTSAYSVISSLFFTQCVQTLYYIADNVYDCNGKRLPIHHQFILDEFANIGLIPEFEKLISTMRSRRIGAAIILQNIGQLIGLYKEQYQTIIGNCDTKISLGSSDPETTKFISELLGVGTIITKEYSYTKHGKTISYRPIERKLKTPDEIASMKDSDCIVMIRGFKPFLSKKYSIKKHPHYKTFDSKKNIRNIEKYFQYKKITDFLIKECYPIKNSKDLRSNLLFFISQVKKDSFYSSLENSELEFIGNNVLYILKNIK